MSVITKEVRADGNIRKIFGIPFLQKSKKTTPIATKSQYKLFGIPIYRKTRKNNNVESVLHEMRTKIEKIHCLIDTLWLSNMQEEKFEGQLGQDAIAYSILRNKKNGFFVDIGANDGVNISNSYLFERLGWRGFCVEANPNTYEILRKNRQCDTYNLAVFSQNIGMTTLVTSNSEISALDTLDTNLTAAHKKRLDSLGDVTTISVQTATFNEIMQHYPDVTHIDFMSLDVEGGEMEVLRGIDFEKYSFSVMAIEHNYTDSKEKIIDFLGQRGYRLLMQDGWDIIFVNDLRIQYSLA